MMSVSEISVTMSYRYTGQASGNNIRLYQVHNTHNDKEGENQEQSSYSPSPHLRPFLFSESVPMRQGGGFTSLVPQRVLVA